MESTGPIAQSVWGNRAPLQLFTPPKTSTNDDAAQAMDRSLEVVRNAQGDLFDDSHKIRSSLIQELGACGYWGLLVGKQYGGSGSPLASFMPFLTRMACLSPTIAGEAAVHGCIGATNLIQRYGTPAQKERFLPSLARGTRLSAFALTEPGAGSDLTALRTTAQLAGDEYIVNGEKAFITGAQRARTIALVCLVEGRPAVLIVELPAEENDHFQLRRYGLHPLKHTHNNGIVLRNFAVPAQNLLVPPKGDGLTIAYHGLNAGRVALCANAAGTMRLMLASLLPWAKFRKTYGAAIETRELVQRRIGRLASLIVGADALARWGAGLLDLGVRAEMECIVAKVFASEALKEAAIDLLMRTHGGRSFLEGHIFGDHVHDYLAPSIYEGEGEMLSLALFRSLSKTHVREFFEPIAGAAKAAGIEQLNLKNPRHAWQLRRNLAPYAGWLVSRARAGRTRLPMAGVSKPWRRHAEFAAAVLQHTGGEISALIRRHGTKLAGRQCRIAEISQRVQRAVTILCVSMSAAEQEDPVLQTAADCLCEDITRTLTGNRPSDAYFRKVTLLGAKVAEGGFTSIVGLEPAEILMRYDSPA